MRLIKNAGNERVLDELRSFVASDVRLDICSPTLSLFAFDELRGTLTQANASRLITPVATIDTDALLGGFSDRPFRNRLQVRWLARQAATWLNTVSFRDASGPVPQSLIIATKTDAKKALFGACALSTVGNLNEA
jgi:hypothetical protein